MILDATRKEGKTHLSIPPKNPKGGHTDGVSAGDVIEVEVIREGKRIYKGR
jgi:hypothetical protein